MYIKDGIAYAGEPKQALKITEVRPLEGSRLWLRFNTGETGVADMAPLLGCKGFAPLSDKALFDSVSLDRGVPVWAGGDMDIAPEWLYENRVTPQDTKK